MEIKTCRHLCRHVHFGLVQYGLLFCANQVAGILQHLLARQPGFGHRRHPFVIQGGAGLHPLVGLGRWQRVEGLVMSEQVQGNPDWKDNVAALVNQRSLKREAIPEDMVGVVLFLATSDSGFLTGQTIVADGGIVMH